MVLTTRVILAFTLYAACAEAQIGSETTAAIDKLAAKALADSGTPAVSIAIIKDGKVAMTKAYGDARLEPRTAATEGMRFSIGSVSKQFLAGAILLAAEQGKLSLDDRVAKYLPTLTRAKDVTVRQLLSHTAGYQDYYPQDYLPPFMLVPVTPEGMMDRWARKPLDFEPGTAWQYSNTGYVVAGQVLEKATGVGVMEFLRARVFTKLGMKSVYDLDHQPLGAADAAGYIRYAIGPLHAVRPEASGWLYAAGELAMTAGDLALWDAALINGSLLKAGSFAEMIKPVALKNGTPGSYGSGVGVADANGHPRVSHGGAVSGFTSQNTVWPDLKLALVVLSNKDGSSAPERITRGVAELLLAPAQDPDAARLLEQAKAIFAGLQDGKLDRSLFRENGNAYFTAEVLGDYAASLKPLGKPKSFEFQRGGLRGGFTQRSYRLDFEKRSLRLVVRATMDGKLEQYQISE